MDVGCQKLRSNCDFEISAATLTHEMDVGHQKLRSNCDFGWSAATLSHKMDVGRQKLRYNSHFGWSAATLSHEMDLERQRLRSNCDFEVSVATLCVKASVCGCVCVKEKRVCVCTIWTDVKLLIGFHKFAGGARDHCKSGTNKDTCLDLWYQKGTPFWRTCQSYWNGKRLNPRTSASFIWQFHFTALLSQSEINFEIYIHQNLPQIFAETISPTVLCVVTYFRRDPVADELWVILGNNRRTLFWISTCWSKLYGIWLWLRLTISDALHRFREVPHVALLFIK